MGTSASVMGETCKASGNAAFTDGDYASAEVSYSASLLNDPENASLYSNRSAARVGLDKFWSAYEDASEAMRLRPEWPKGYFRAGCALVGMKRYAEAERFFMKAVAVQYPVHDARLQEEIDKVRAELQGNPTLRGRGALYTWGKSSSGVCGHGDTKDAVRAKVLEQLRGVPIRDLAAGMSHNVIISQSGEVFVWGDNGHAQCGYPGEALPSTVFLSPTALLLPTPRSRARAVACGAAHSVLLTDDGQVYSWGLATNGQCGIEILEGTKVVETPMRVTHEVEGRRITGVACGLAHTILLDSEGSCYVFGWNNHGQCGVGDSAMTVKLPRAIMVLKDIGRMIHVSGGGTHSCVIGANGKVYTFGCGGSGQLGHGDDGNKDIPTLVKGLSSMTVVYASCGEEYTTVVTFDHKVFSFGLNNVGQLGDGGPENHVSPFEVEDLSNHNIEVVNSAQGQTFGVSRDGKLISWGIPDDEIAMLDRGGFNQGMIHPQGPKPHRGLGGKIITRMECGRRHYCAVLLAPSPMHCTSDAPAVMEVTSGQVYRTKVYAVYPDGTRATTGGDRFDVVLVNELTGVTVTDECYADDNMDGSYDIAVKMIECGVYSFHILLQGTEICGSPFHMEVKQGKPWPSKCLATMDIPEGTEGEDLLIRVGESVGIEVTTFDKFSNRIEVGGEIIRCEVGGAGTGKVVTHDHEDGTYSLSVSLAKSGYHTISVFVGADKVPIPNSPFIVTVSAGAAYPAKCIAQGKGLESAAVGERNTFDIFLRDEEGNKTKNYSGEWEVIVRMEESKELIESRLVSWPGGGWSASYKPTTCGHCIVEVRLEGTLIQKAPFRVPISAGVADALFSSASGNGLEGCVIDTNGIDRSITVEVRDSHGNDLKRGGDDVLAYWEETDDAGNKTKADIDLADNDDGTYTGSYHVSNPGLRKVYITLNGENVAGCPFMCPYVLSEDELSRREQELQRAHQEAEMHREKLERERKKEEEESKISPQEKKQREQELLKEKAKLEKQKREEMTRKRAAEALRRMEENRRRVEAMRKRRAMVKRCGGGFNVRYAPPEDDSGADHTTKQTPPTPQQAEDDALILSD